MTIVLIIASAALGVWGAILARRTSLWAGCAAFVAFGYVLGPPLWSPKLGPVTLTADRALLIALGCLFLWQWRSGRLELRQLTEFDWLLGLALAYFTVRCALTPPPPTDGSPAGPWWRLIASVWTPAALYVVARSAPIEERGWRQILVGLSALGAFLAFTSFAEIGKQWWAVFPSYIADPSLGTHFGRARGPALNSASLGVMLTICFWAPWMLFPTLRRSWRLLAIALMGSIAAAVYFTYTRSTWIGLAGTLAIIPLFQIPSHWRQRATICVLLFGLAGGIAVSGKLTSMGRKDSDDSAEHSVYQRASFAYVSARMFADAPIFGCGFGRFYDLKMPYLADRTQRIELESIRDLDHHNTFLSVLVETGIVGLALFGLLLAGWTRAMWVLIRDAEARSWQRTQAIFSLAVMITYLSSALFHDLTLLPSEQWVLFLTSGATVGLVAQRRQILASAHSASLCSHVESMGSQRKGVYGMSSPSRVRLFGMSIDVLDMTGTLDKIVEWIGEPRNEECRFVVTPNVDHAVMFQTNGALRAAYESAALVLADGAPIVAASRLLRRPLPERVAGSDLAPALFKRAAQIQTSAAGENYRDPLKVFLLGAAPGVADRAAINIHQRWRGVQVVGTMSPPIGFEQNPIENARILAAIAAVKPDVLLVGLGAPKQELWVAAHARRLDAKVALCIGATIDFLAGEKQRAPRWMRRFGLEWIHRLASEPGRLARRYGRDAWIFPQLVWRDWRRAET